MKNLFKKENLITISKYVLVIIIVVLTITTLDSKIDKRNTVSSTSETRQLEDVISTIEGVGENKVLINSKDNKMAGIIISCEGGNNPYVVDKLKDGISSVFNISKAKISVFEMKKGD